MAAVVSLQLKGDQLAFINGRQKSPQTSSAVIRHHRGY